MDVEGTIRFSHILCTINAFALENVVPLSRTGNGREIVAYTFIIIKNTQLCLTLRLAIPEALSLYCLCTVASSYLKPADPCFVLPLCSCVLS